MSDLNSDLLSFGLSELEMEISIGTSQREFVCYFYKAVCSNSGTRDAFKILPGVSMS